MMYEIKRRCLITLLLLVGAGCSTARTSDPFGASRSSVSPTQSRQASREDSGRTGTATGGDPFLAAQQEADRHQPGRVMLSDQQAGDLTAQDASHTASLPQEPPGHPPEMTGGGDVRTADEQAARALIDAQVSRAAQGESDTERRLRELEWELQFTDDQATQDQLAIEIARLRKQLRRSGQ